MRKRSGSEKRQRGPRITVRFTEEEIRTVRAKAEKSGISVSALIRLAVLDLPPPRAARRPTVQLKAVAQLLGNLGRIGSNVNQLAKHANAGRYQQDSIELAMRDLMDMRMACLQALGREPANPKDS